MKKLLFLAFVAVFGHSIFAQSVPTVAVATFDTVGGVSREEAEVITELFITELVSSGAVSVVERLNFDKIIAEMRFQTSDWSNAQKTAAVGNALNAQLVIRGQIMKMGSSMYWTATVIDVNTARVLYSAREQVKDVDEIINKLPNFAQQIVVKIPPPNIFVGRWRSTEGNFTCILEFKPDGTIFFEQFDYYRGRERVTSKGTGTYAFQRYLGRLIFEYTLSLEDGHTDSKNVFQYDFNGNNTIRFISSSGSSHLDGIRFGNGYGDQYKILVKTR